jgi:hypothetical protein
MWMRKLIVVVMASTVLCGTSLAFSGGYPWWLATNTSVATNNSIRVDTIYGTNLYVYRLILSGAPITNITSTSGTSTVFWAESDPIAYLAFTNWLATSSWASVSITNTFATTNWVDTYYYPRSNPSNYISTSGGTISNLTVRGLKMAVTRTNTSYTITSYDVAVEASGTTTLTLPASSGGGQAYLIYSLGTTTVNPAGTDTINGDSSKTLSSNSCMGVEDIATGRWRIW